MNLASMLNRFYQDLKESDTNRYPVALVKEWLDESERVINKASKTIRASSITNSVANQRLYSMPTNLLDWNIRDIYYSVTTSSYRRRLVPITIEKLDKIDRGWRERTGSPTYWYIDREQNKWGLYPYELTVSSGTNCIEILYRQKHTKMTRYYTTGTVSITNGSTSVTGAGTTFIGNVIANDQLGIGILLSRTTAFPIIWHTVASTPVSNTALTLSAAFSEATVSGVNYIIASPSSIQNDELNLCSVMWAMGLAKAKDGDYDGMNAFQTQAMRRCMHEVEQLEETSASEESLIPELAEPYPGVDYGDYA